MTCLTCKNTQECQACLGSKVVLEEICTECNGSGECQECIGSSGGTD